MSSRLEEAVANEDGDEISRSSGAHNSESEKTWEKSDREFLMVVATFVAAMAFQAGINPPGSVWQDDGDPRYQAGKSIMATKSPSQFVTFIASVTVCMACSLMQVLVLLQELPYKRLSVSRNFIYFTMGTAVSGMASAYWSSVTALTPEPLMPQVTLALATNLVFSVVGLVITTCLQKRISRNRPNVTAS